MKYPIVLCCGLYGYGEQDEDKHPDLLPYWGYKGNNLVDYLQKKGYEVYHPSLGPYNGAWDRACILWAYLFGGRVDFGKIHSAMRGHERYGETYPGVLNDLGKTKAHAKIELFGHSFGGSTVKEISNLFTQGDELERKSGEHSPLFDGGHGDLIHTVTTLSGVNNGTTLATLANRSGLSLATILGIMMTEGANNSSNSYDSMLQHWSGNSLEKFVKYSKNELDNIAREMDIDTIQRRINPKQVMNPNTYYFAQRAYAKPSEMTGSCKYCGHLMNTFPLAGMKYSRSLDDLIGWNRNDGFVDVTGQSAPLNQPHEKGYWSGMKFRPGIWYNMPEKPGKDHLYWCGHSGDINELCTDFDRMLTLFDKVK